ncbi:hypothetical protein BKA70DRAFT_1431964 [Coprinopsis sp. MPI-PUGE-AT-0042]|nr:hypothetical protein BKA70DRAFT_1431964 [Coprinopsis sp. MPI-PUGE-AT-0042]
MALASLALRDISQPHLFHSVWVSVRGVMSDSEARECAVSKISIFENNARLIDYIRHFNMLYQWDDWDSEYRDQDLHRGYCQQTLIFLLPRLTRLERFMTQSQSSTIELPWDYIWDEPVKKAVSSCIASNHALKTFEVRGWAGPVCFLQSLPVSLEKLKVIHVDIELKPIDGVDAASESIQARPKTFELGFALGMPTFVLAQGITFLSQLHTLELRSHESKNLNVLLGMVSKTLRCLKLHYWAHNTSGLRSRFLCLCETPPSQRFISVPGLQELEIAVEVDGPIREDNAADLWQGS